MADSMQPYRGPDRRGGVADDSRRYRGPDRRDRTPLAGSARPTARAWLIAMMVFVAIGVLAAPGAYGGAGAEVSVVALRDTTGCCFVLVGALSLVLWGLGGLAARALDGVGFSLIGAGLLVVSGPWSQVIDPGAMHSALGAAGRLAGGVPGLVILVISARAAPIDTEVRPIRYLRRGGFGLIAVLATEGLVRVGGPIERPWQLVTMMVVLAAGYYAAGARRLMKSAETATPDDCDLGWALVWFAFSEVVLAVGFRAAPWCGVVGGAIQLSAVLAMVLTVSTSLIRVLKKEGRFQLQLVNDLADVSDAFEGQEVSRRRLTHDARNAMAAIRTAIVTLERYGPRLEPGVQAQIREGIGAEMHRLEELLDPAPSSPDALAVAADS
jgi:hypothetical protein